MKWAVSCPSSSLPPTGFDARRGAWYRQTLLRSFQMFHDVVSASTARHVSIKNPLERVLVYSSADVSSKFHTELWQCHKIRLNLKFLIFGLDAFHRNAFPQRCRQEFLAVLGKDPFSEE